MKSKIKRQFILKKQKLKLSSKRYSKSYNLSYKIINNEIKNKTEMEQKQTYETKYLS